MTPPSAASANARPAAFLDRDGVLIVDHGYVYRPADLQWIPGAVDAVRYLNEIGYYVFVVTNQSGVARGYFDETAVCRFHDHMQTELKEQGAHIEAFYYCPHHPDGTVKRYAVHCVCRKPGIGLLQQAAAEWRPDLARSFLIGDKTSDLKAAAAFGIRGVHFDSATMQLAALVRRTVTASATAKSTD